MRLLPEFLIVCLLEFEIGVSEFSQTNDCVVYINRFIIVVARSLFNSNLQAVL